MEVISKKRFAAMVRIWINHKIAISENSLGNHYKNAAVISSFGKINDLLKLVRRDCNEYNLSDLYRMVIRNEQDLRNILPSMKNPSYGSQIEKLEYIISTCKSNLK